MPLFPRIRISRRFNLLFALILTCIPWSVYSQKHIEDSLIKSCNSAKTDFEAINRLGALSDYYFANKMFSKGDSLVEKQLMLAEASLDRSLILSVLFGNAAYKSTGTSTRDRSANTVSYIKRALTYANEHDIPDYSALANANLAELYNTDGQLEEAFKHASLAFTTALNTDNDSAKVICAIQLGNNYLKRSDVLTAFKTFTNAQNIANQQKKEYLLPPVFYSFSQLYKKLDKVDIARNYVFRSLAINKKIKDVIGQVNDYIMLAKLSTYTAAKDYLKKAITLSDQAGKITLKIEAERVLFFYMLLRETPEYMIAYLEQQPELKNVFISTGPNYIDWMYAEIYLYGKQPGKAISYFKNAEASFNSGYDLTSKKNFFTEMASCYSQLDDRNSAIEYSLKSIELSKTTADLNSVQHFTAQLKNLYEKQGNFEEAYKFSVLEGNYKDSVDLLGREKDLAVLEIENETKRQKIEAEQAALLLRRKYNMQYMMITIVVASVFLFLLMLGMFRVSTFTIRLMGFLSLIFLFELIILILDTWIHHITHGEPWKVWLIKIGIIAILLPIHHFLEHKLIQYLLSRHLIVLRGRMSLSRLFSKKKKPLPKKILKEEAGVV
jgi:hypothetical protein